MKPKILPGTGRGTIPLGMVEGHSGPILRRASPSTTFGGPPPRSGEDL